MSFTATDYPSGALVGSGKHNVTLSGSAVPDGMLLFASLGGTETVGELFTYSIKLKTPDILNLGYVSPAANLPLKQMVGKDLCVNIELDGGGKRYISGLVTAARVAGHQGRSVLYELRIEPWLKILTHTSDYKAFQNKNVVDISPAKFHECFINWMRDCHTSDDKDVIAIDGKTLRYSYDKSRRKGAIHVISAFTTMHILVIGQIKTDEKSNEITAIPELFNMLDIKGKIITTDAMGCQKEKMAIDKD